MRLCNFATTYLRRVYEEGGKNISKFNETNFHAYRVNVVHVILLS